MTPLIAIILGVVLAVVILYLVSRSRRSNDGVDSFRRQIDALSPEARRPVIDQINKSPDRSDPPVDPPIDPSTRPIDSAASGGDEGDHGDHGDDGDDGGRADEGGPDGA